MITIRSVLKEAGNLENARQIEEELLFIEDPILAYEHPDEVKVAADIIARTNAALFRNRREDGSSQTRQSFLRTYAPTRTMIALYYKDHGVELELSGLNYNDGTELFARVLPTTNGNEPSVTMKVDQMETGWPIFSLTTTPA